MNVALIDYGAGNLASVRKALAAVGADVVTARSPVELGGAAAIVIPGVGHFDATTALHDGWRSAIGARLEAGAAVLGICLGMQWLFDGSDEAPHVPGLGILGGRCFRLSGDVKVPHVGWNSLDDIAPASRLLDGVAVGSSMYFTHAFAAPVVPEGVAFTTHGRRFASVVERGRIFGVQGHPEKSASVGLRILANFAAVAREAAC